MSHLNSADKIRGRYNPEHDTGPDAPVPWYVIDLLYDLERMESRLEALESSRPEVPPTADPSQPKRPDRLFVFVKGGLVQGITDAYGKDAWGSRAVVIDYDGESDYECPICHGTIPESARRIVAGAAEYTCPYCTYDSAPGTTLEALRAIHADYCPQPGDYVQLRDGSGAPSENHISVLRVDSYLDGLWIVEDWAGETFHVIRNPKFDTDLNCAWIEADTTDHRPPPEGIEHCSRLGCGKPITAAEASDNGGMCQDCAGDETAGRE